jgi:hypothetical protein
MFDRGFVASVIFLFCFASSVPFIGYLSCREIADSVYLAP